MFSTARNFKENFKVNIYSLAREFQIFDLLPRQYGKHLKAMLYGYSLTEYPDIHQLGEYWIVDSKTLALWANRK